MDGMLTFAKLCCDLVVVNLDLMNVENDGQEFGVRFGIPVDHCDELAVMQSTRL